MASEEIDLQAILQFTVNVARKAGALILEGSQAIQSSAPIGAKKNSVDLVTEYDVKVEELVRAEVGTAYPQFQLQVSSRMRFSYRPLTRQSKHRRGIALCRRAVTRRRHTYFLR